jgi:hypothetical protein
VLNPKRGAKRLAVSAAISNAGLAPTALKLLRIGYGPLPVEPRGTSTACVSVDFDVTQPSRFDDNRKGTLALCELSARYGIPLTWAVCGRSAEEDMRSYSAIAEAAGGSEIGVHTYSHLDATAATKDDFRSDIERCIQVLGLASPRTFVFPWNREAHFDVLQSLGFRVYRGKDRAIGAPILNQGLWDVRPVYYVDQKSRGAESLMKRYVDLCIHYSTPFHLWTHPWALVVGGETTEMMRTLESLFAYIVEMRDGKSLETSTLGAVAATLATTDGSRPEPVSSLVHAS